MTRRRPPHGLFPGPTPPSSWQRLLALWREASSPLPDRPEVRRVKMSGYLFALLVATPGLLLLLHELLRQRAYATALTHASVLVGAALLFPWVIRRPERLARAEVVFASLLTVSAVNFLVSYAAQPERVMGHELLGNVLLFIVAGLLLVLSPRASIPLTLGLLATYHLEVAWLSGRPPQELRLTQWVHSGMLALLLVGVIMRQTLTHLTARLGVLEEWSTRDPLTGLLNRRGFEQASAVGRTGGQSGVLVVLDIDDFKQINDAHGHVAGDRILARLGDLLSAQVPAGSLCARWGGEEFVVYLPHARLAQAQQVADALRQSVAGEFEPPAMTVSVGLAEWRAGDALHQTFQRADDAMYAAKRQGKNRVLSAG